MAAAPKALMIAFHFPPETGSGVHRTLKFVDYLPEFGWRPLVLSAHPRAFEHAVPESVRQIPEGVPVERAFALDSARHLAIAGRYLRLTALPDRWISWWLGGVPAGLRMIRRYRPRVIWSTYPFGTAHLIAWTLHRLTGIPWVADFRDPMIVGDHPFDPALRRVRGWLERQVVRHADRVTVTTPGTRSLYAGRYAERGEDHFRLVENGYDEDSFSRVERALSSRGRPDGPLTLVHSGVFYRDGRDPSAFFSALARFRQDGRIGPRDLRVILRGCGDTGYYQRRLDEQGIADLVSLEPHVPYEQALAELLTADGLLLFQGSRWNAQIPAKLYEYFRARRPILALVDEAGDTARLIRSQGIDTLAPIEDAGGIATALESFLRLLRAGGAPLVAADRVERFSRRARTAELAKLFDEVAGGA